MEICCKTNKQVYPFIMQVRVHQGNLLIGTNNVVQVHWKALYNNFSNNFYFISTQKHERMKQKLCAVMIYK